MEIVKPIRILLEKGTKGDKVFQKLKDSKSSFREAVQNGKGVAYLQQHAKQQDASVQSS